MALTKIQRVRIIMDLIKDGDVTTESNYDNPALDYASAALATKYADALIETHQGQDPSSMDNAEKSRRVLNILKKMFRVSLVNTRGDDAGQTERGVAGGEADTEVGTEE